MGNREVKSFIFICVFVLILSGNQHNCIYKHKGAWMVKAVYAGTEDAQKFYERLSTMTEEDFYRALNKINTRCDAGRETTFI